LHGAVLRSPYPSARIRQIDAAPAAALPGVVAVVLAGRVAHNTLWANIPGPASGGGPRRARIQVLGGGGGAYQGQRVALVAALTRETAQQAAELIAVDYEPLPGVFDPAVALEAGAPRVHDEGNLLASWQITQGDAEAALREAETVVETTYRCQFI